MSQYFENDDNLKSKKRYLYLYINDKNIPFLSDSGVFSNNQIDYGSFVFLRELLKEKKVNKILDMGCGYGALGITLKVFDMASHIDMFDINSKAISLCEYNIKNNNLDNITCMQSDGFLNVNDKYDMIVINPPIRAGKKVIYKMFDDSINYLNNDGALYIVIKKSLGAPSAINKLKTIYKNVVVLNIEKGYYIIKSFS